MFSSAEEHARCSAVRASVIKMLDTEFGFVTGFTLPSLWSSGQSSWLQIQKYGFDSRCHQVFWEVAGLELSLVSTIEELLQRKSSGSGLENREYGRMNPLWWPQYTLYSNKLALTSRTSGTRLVSVVCSRTKAMELLLLLTGFNVLS
jgi:hypothetical protein